MRKLEELNISEFEAEYTAKNCSTAGGITLVLANKNGKRIEFSATLLSKLKVDAENSDIQILPTDEGVLLGKNIVEGAKIYNLKFAENSKRGVLYCASLLNEIIEKYQIDMEGHKCKTFTKVEEIESDNDPIVLIKFN